MNPLKGRRGEGEKGRRGEGEKGRRGTRPFLSPSVFLWFLATISPVGAQQVENPFGVPLGGIGCGTLEIRPDGTITRATINNNWDRPTGDLKGCFAAVWTNAGGRIQARALQRKNGYNLPTVAALDFRGLFPQVFADYPDPALPIRLSLRAYSSLIPHDIKNSTLPVVLFVFTLQNESRAPVEAAIALSWENFLGVGGTSARGAFADRTGNTVNPIPPILSPEGTYGLRFESATLPAVLPSDPLPYNARGDYALLAQSPTSDAKITTAGWNALDAAPGWWAQFAKEGTVAGTVGTGQEGRVHPAGVVALKVSLKDKETREIAFAVAWRSRRLYTLSSLEVGHYYEKSFADAVAVAHYALESRLALAALTEEWQNRLLRSSLPPWLAHRLLNDAAALVTNTLLTRDSGLNPKPGPFLFATLESLEDGHGALGAMDKRLLSHSLLAAWFPALDLLELKQFAAAQAPSGAIPRHIGTVEEGIGAAQADLTPQPPSLRGKGEPNPQPSRSDSPFPASAASEPGKGAGGLGPEASCSYVFQIYRRFRWTGDQTFLDLYYPSAKRAVEFVATLDTNGDGLPEGPSLFGDAADGYSASLWLGTLKTARRMAAAMQDRGFEAQCAEWFDRAQKSALTRLWNERFLFAYQLAGQWMADAAEAGDILPPEVVNKTLDSLAALNDRAFPLGPPREVHPDGTPTEDRTFCLPCAIVYQAALYTLRGRPDAGLALMKRLDDLQVEKARAPWQAFQTFRADTGEPLGGSRHMTGPASWNYLYALEGFTLDLPAGRLTLTPHLPSGWTTLSAPLFAPTFWAWLDYRPTARRTTLIFRLDRTMPIAGTKPSAPLLLQGEAGLVLKQVVLPGGSLAAPQVSASVGRAPAPGKAVRDAQGRLVFTFDAPLKLTSGQRLEFSIR